MDDNRKNHLNSQDKDDFAFKIGGSSADNTENPLAEHKNSAHERNAFHLNLEKSDGAKLPLDAPQEDMPKALNLDKIARKNKTNKPNQMGTLKIINRPDEEDESPTQKVEFEPMTHPDSFEDAPEEPLIKLTPDDVVPFVPKSKKNKRTSKTTNSSREASSAKPMQKSKPMPKPDALPPSSAEVPFFSALIDNEYDVRENVRKAGPLVFSDPVVEEEIITPMELPAYPVQAEPALVEPTPVEPMPIEPISAEPTPAEPTQPVVAEPLSEDAFGKEPVPAEVPVETEPVQQAEQSNNEKTVVLSTPVIRKESEVEVREILPRVQRAPQNVRVQRTTPPKRKKKKKRASALGIFLRIMLALILVGTLTFGAMGAVYATVDILGLKEEASIVEITIQPQTSVSDIAEMLKENKVIQYPKIFKLYIKYKLKNEVLFNYGTYQLHPKMSYEGVIEELEKVAGSTNQIRITIPEHFNVTNIADTLQDNGICTREEFLTAINAYDLANPTAGADDEKRQRIKEILSTIENPEQRMYKLEGYLFPDTYTFTPGTASNDVINTMLANFETKYSHAMAVRGNNVKGYSIDQVMRLASIVQAEAPNKIDMLKIADVYENRLKNPKKFPKLQSDPTRKYGQLVILENGGTQEMAATYNTYETNGLIPGPINCPGLEAIKAVLYPAETEYTFFCSNLQTQECFYATTDAEHEQNLVKAGLK